MKIFWREILVFRHDENVCPLGAVATIGRLQFAGPYVEWPRANTHICMTQCELAELGRRAAAAANESAGGFCVPCAGLLSLSLSFFSLPLFVFHFLRGLRVYRLSVFLAAQRCRLDAAERNPRCLARESRFPSLSFSAFVCEIMCAKGLCMCVRRIIARNTGWLSLPPFFSGPFFRLRPLAATCVCILPNDCPLVWLWADDQDIEARYEAVSLLF